jgi:hypothetical protein
MKQLTTEKVLKDIRNERDYQDTQWGQEFDDKNTLNDWATYIIIYLGNATSMGTDPAEQRRQLIKVATLSVAALESFDRNNGFPPRHYDGDN